MCNYYAPHSGRSLRNRPSAGIQLVPRSGIVRRAEPPDGFTALVSRSGRAAHGIDSIHPSMDRDRASSAGGASGGIYRSIYEHIGRHPEATGTSRRTCDRRPTTSATHITTAITLLAATPPRTHVRHDPHRRPDRLSHGKYTWDEAVATLAGAYRNVLACSLASQQATAQY